ASPVTPMRRVRPRTRWSGFGRSIMWPGVPAGRQACRRLGALNQLDLIAVRILDEGDHRGAELHRPGLAGDPGAGLPEVVAGLVDVRQADREVAEAVPELVPVLLIPVVGQLDDRGPAALLGVTDEGQGVFAFGHLAA